MADFLELSFELGCLDPQLAEDTCCEYGATAVTLEDARDDAVFEPLPGELRLWPSTRLKALFDAAADPATLAAALGSRLGLPRQALATQLIADRAWEREWLKDFHAMRFGRRLWICPRHEEVRDPGAVIVTLDPGLAFGTGTHASTALCLEWLDAQLTPGARAIDYGCGSGVLAVAAARLGAQRVDCFDLDPQARLATQQNAAANGVAALVHVHTQAAYVPAGADVLLANILCGTLCELAPAFAGLLRPGGTAVLAGILEHQVAQVTAAYLACFDVQRCGGRNGWAALSARRH